MHLSNRNLYFIHFTFCKSYYLLLLEFVLPSFVGFTYCFPIFNPLAFSQPPWNIFHSPGDKSLTGWIDSHVSFRCRSSFSLTFLSFTPFRRPSSTNTALPLSVTHVLRFACQPSTSSPRSSAPFPTQFFRRICCCLAYFQVFHSLSLSASSSPWFFQCTLLKTQQVLWLSSAVVGIQGALLPSPSPTRKSQQLRQPGFNCNSFLLVCSPC